jgi:hypothetical protein
VCRHTNSFIHLKAVAKRCKRQRTKQTNHCQSQEEEGAIEEAKEKEAQEEEPWDACEGCFPNSCFPPSPVLEEQIPDNLPREENEEPPAEDEWFFPVCKNSPCLFLQHQDELEHQVDIMYPLVTNKQKRYHMYRHMS